MKTNKKFIFFAIFLALLFTLISFILFEGSEAFSLSYGSALFLSGLLGALRGLFSLSIEHPLDVMKTRRQAARSEQTLLETMITLYREKGIEGFYAGWIPNMMRAAIKSFYRYPMMLAFPLFYSMFLSSPTLSSAATGLSIAFFEVGIINPFERLKVWIITRKSTIKGITAFFHQHRGHLFEAFYKGTSATIPRQMVAWLTFLVADERVTAWMLQMTGQQRLTFFDLMVVSLVVGVVNTLTVMPFDTIKTNMQKCGSGEKKRFKDVYLEIIKTKGLGGLYAGSMPRMIQYMIQAGLTMPFLDALRHSPFLK